MDQKELIKKVGEFCRDFRINQLNMSLTEFCNISELNIKNVSAFEHGRANNIKYLFKYYRICNDSLKKQFASELFKIL